MSNDKTKVLFSENQFNILFKNIPIPIYVWQKVKDDLIFIDYNYAAGELTSDSIKNFLGNKASQIYKDNAEILKDLNRCANSKISFSKEMEDIVKNTGEKKILNVKYVFIHPDLVLVHTEDIYDRKKAEEEIGASEKKFSMLINHLYDAIFLLKLTENNMPGQFFEVNDIACQRYGYTRKEFLKISLKDIFDPDLIEEIPSLMKKLLKTEYLRFDTTHITKNGLKMPINITIYIFKHNGENIVISIAKDMNEYTKIEQKLKESEKSLKKFNKELELKVEERTKELKESEEKFRTIAEQSLMGIAILQNNSFKYVNQQYAKISGYSVEELKSWAPGEFIKMVHPKYRALVMEQARKKQIGLKDVINHYEFQGIKKTGELNWIEIFSKTINYDGELADLIAVLDITSKKEAEQKLKESEEKFKMITEQSLMGICIVQDYKFKYVNKTYADIWGYTVKEIMNWEFGDFIKRLHPDDKNFILDQLKKKQKGHQDIIIKYSCRGFKKSGEIIWVEIFSKPVTYKSRLADLVTIVDITERKIAVKKLKESEEKYRIITENANDLIALYNEKLECEYINERVLKNVLGYSFDDIKGKSSLRIIHPDEIKNSLTNFKKAFENGKGIGEVRVKSKDGTYKWIESKGKVYVENGKKKLILISRDITERKNAEQKLKESEQKFRTITEQSIMGIFIMQDDLIKYANQGMSEMIGYPIEEMKNWASGEFIKFIDPDYRDFFKNQEYMEKKDLKDWISHYKLQIIRKNGKKKWLEIFSKSINYRGRPANFFTTMDITEKKEAEEELIKLNKLKSDLLRRTSHELKTPLVSIKGNTDLLLKLHYEKLDNFTISILEEIEEGCERLGDLIKQLIESSTLESGQVQLKSSKEDLAFLINFCVRELKSLANARAQKIDMDIQEKLITRFEKEKIYEVIINLLSNAIKYTPKNGKIKIMSEIKDDFYIISVKDNGVGFTKEEKKQIFKQFGKIERYGQGWDLGIEGSGLGLYISKKIVELHGGKIWAESEGRNKGSVFSFSLPIIND